ncbi:MAG: hypothetical protein Q4G39_09755, partial [Brachymonas sp.]|nr:hypothetical protein [Brachymonas sp.]
MKNQLRLRPTSWKAWYSLLAIAAFFLGSQASLLTQLAENLSPGVNHTVQMLATPLQFIAFAVLALAAFALVTKKWPTAEDLGLRPTLTLREIGLLAAVFVVTHLFFWLLSRGMTSADTSAVPTTKEMFEEMGLGKGLASDFASLVSVVILAPICEEILYRGLILRPIHDGLLRKWPAAAVAVA